MCHNLRDYYYLSCSAITSDRISSGKAARKLGSTPSGISILPRIAEYSPASPTLCVNDNF